MTALGFMLRLPDELLNLNWYLGTALSARMGAKMSVEPRHRLPRRIGGTLEYHDLGIITYLRT